MSEGTYTDREGRKVTVKRTSTGYLLRYADGQTVLVRR